MGPEPLLLPEVVGAGVLAVAVCCPPWKNGFNRVQKIASVSWTYKIAKNSLHSPPQIASSFSTRLDHHSHQKNHTNHCQFHVDQFPRFNFLFETFPTRSDAFHRPGAVFLYDSAAIYRKMSQTLYWFKCFSLVLTEKKLPHDKLCKANNYEMSGERVEVRNVCRKENLSDLRAPGAFFHPRSWVSLRFIKLSSGNGKERKKMN